MKLRTPIVAILTVAALQPAVLFAQPAGGHEDSAAIAQLERTLVDVIARVEPSVVAISRTSAQQQPPVSLQVGDAFGELRASIETGSAPVATGAGVVIDPSGLVLTQYLAVRDGDEHTVTTTDGKRYAATIKAADPRSSLAVLAIPANPLPANPLQRAGNAAADSQTRPATFPALTIGDADALRKGQFVVAVGNPYAIQTEGEPTASWGIVTNLAQKAPAGTNLNDALGPARDHRTTLHHLGTLIQTDAKLGWSAGGGALVNLRGELVGIITTVATIAGHEQPAGYAIPTSAPIRRIIDILKQGREVEYGLLGITFDVGPTGASGDTRVVVQNVVPHTPADRAGFAPGDVITHVDGEPIRNVDHIQLAISLQPPRAVTTIDYERRGEAATAYVALTKLSTTGTTVVTNRPPAWRGIHVDYAVPLTNAESGWAALAEAFDPEGCVVVSEVERDSEAWNAGFRAGMFISHVGERRVATPDEFRAAATDAVPLSDVRLTRPVQADNQEPAANGRAR